MKIFKKQIISLTLSIALIVSSICAAGIQVQYAQAATKKTMALKKYKSALKKKKIPVSGGDNYKLYKDTEFGIVDLNHDGVPELIVNYEHIYTYYNGKITEVLLCSQGITAYKKGSVFMSESMHAGNGHFNFYSIVKGHGKMVANEALLESGEHYCYIGNKEVSKKKYNKYIKKLTKKSETIEIPMYSLTNRNINKYVK